MRLSFAVFSLKILNLCFEFTKAFSTKSLLFEDDSLKRFNCRNHKNNSRVHKVGYTNQDFIHVFAKYLKKCFRREKILKIFCLLLKLNDYRLLQFFFWALPLTSHSLFTVTVMPTLVIHTAAEADLGLLQHSRWRSLW